MELFYFFIHDYLTVTTFLCVSVYHITSSMYVFVCVHCLSLYVFLNLQSLQDRDLRPEEIEGIDINQCHWCTCCLWLTLPTNQDNIDSFPSIPKPFTVYLSIYPPSQHTWSSPAKKSLNMFKFPLYKILVVSVPSALSLDFRYWFNTLKKIPSLFHLFRAEGSLQRVWQR